MKIKLTALALIDCTALALAQDLTTNRPAAITFTNGGMVFELDTAPHVTNYSKAIEIALGIQNMILTNDLSRDFWDSQGAREAEIYRSTWDALTPASRLRIALGSPDIKVTWITNGQPHAFPEYAKIYCTNEAQRLLVRDIATRLFRNCLSTKDPPTVTVPLPHRWVTRSEIGAKPSAQAEQPVAESIDQLETPSTSNHGHNPYRESETIRFYQKLVDDPDTDPQLRKAYQRIIDANEAAARDYDRIQRLFDESTRRLNESSP